MILRPPRSTRTDTRFPYTTLFRSFLRTGLNFFSSSLSGEFFLFLVVIYLDAPGIPLSLCSVHSSITCTLFPFFAIFCKFYYMWPFLTKLFKQALIPFLRSEERRVGKECVSSFRSWVSPYHSKKK